MLIAAEANLADNEATTLPAAQTFVVVNVFVFVRESLVKDMIHTESSRSF